MSYQRIANILQISIVLTVIFGFFFLASNYPVLEGMAVKTLPGSVINVNSILYTDGENPEPRRNDYWYGVYGNISLEYETFSAEIGYKQVQHLNVYGPRCEGAELYATTLERISWSKVERAQPGDVDDFLRVAGYLPFSGTKVFTELAKFEVNGDEMLLYATRTLSKEGGIAVGILKQGSTLIYVTKMNNESVTNAFNNVPVNYQFMLPIRPYQPMKYHFFMDPVDKRQCRGDEIIYHFPQDDDGDEDEGYDVVEKPAELETPGHIVRSHPIFKWLFFLFLASDSFLFFLLYLKTKKRRTPQISVMPPPPPRRG